MNTFHFNYKPRAWLTAFALSAFVVGCGSGSDDPAPAPVDPVVPTVEDPVGAACTGGAACVPLNTAGNYVILARDGGITNVAPSVVTGNVGMNAVAAGMTGFSETLAADGTFATSTQVIGGGRMYASDYAAPTPANLTQAIADTGAAFADASNSTTRPVGVGNLDLGVAGNISGLDLPAGVYAWTTGVSVDNGSTVTLRGSATDVWILRVGGGVTMNPGSSVTLAGGALPQNVFWRTQGVVALDTTANLKGIVLSSSSVTMENGASVNGRLFATSAVTLVGNTVTRPAP